MKRFILSVMLCVSLIPYLSDLSLAANDKKSDDNCAGGCCNCNDNNRRGQL